MKKITLLLIVLFSGFFCYSQGVTGIAAHLDIYYATDEFELSKQQKEELLQCINECKYQAYDSSYFYIEAYTDEKGSKEYNTALSQKRAKALADELHKLHSKWTQGSYLGNGIDTLEQNDSLQRHAKITFSNFQQCGTNMKQLADTLDLYDTRWFKNVTEYFSSEAMIKSKMFAIDTDENILKTAGMLSFRLTDAAMQANDFGQQKVSVCVPINKREKFDPNMKLWGSVTNDKGEIRWKQIEGEIVYDAASNCYKCYFKCDNLPGYDPNSPNKDYGFNIDGPVPVEEAEIGSAKNSREQVVYFSTYKDYGFEDVAVTGGKFSAMVKNKEQYVYAFVIDKALFAEESYFYGTFKRKDKKRNLKARLSECDRTGFKRCKYFLQQKKTNYFIDEKEYNRKGIIGWIINLFEKRDNF